MRSYPFIFLGKLPKWTRSWKSDGDDPWSLSKTHVRLTGPSTRVKGLDQSGLWLFQFYPGKNLGAYGEAGAVITNNQRIASRYRMLRDHGQQKKYYHKLVGCNGTYGRPSGCDTERQTEQLDEWNRARRKVAQAYRELLSDIDGLALPKQVTHGTHVYHVFAVRTQRRDRIIEELHANGVHCGIHYPVPIHLQAAYGNLGLDKGSFPVAEQMPGRVCFSTHVSGAYRRANFVCRRKYPQESITVAGLHCVRDESIPEL